MPTSDAPVRPWSPGMTMLLGLAIVLAYSFTQAIAMVPGIVLRIRMGGFKGDVAELSANGLNVALATSVGCPVMLLFCGLIAWARRGPSLAEYLAINLPRPGVVVLWSLRMAVLCLCASFGNDLFERDPPDFVVNAYSTAGYLPFFWVAIALCAPVAEEVFFRGFLFAGLAASKLGATGAVLVTSALFAAMHVGQYDPIDLAELAIFGLAFGYARMRTGSIVVPLAMHIVLNLLGLGLYALGM